MWRDPESLRSACKDGGRCVYAVRNPAAARAACAIAAGSGVPGFTTQLPPTQSTEGSASQSGAVASVIPPVGQNRTAPNTAACAFSALIPPAASAGKNLNRSSP